MSKSRCVLLIFVGALLAFFSVVLFVHDAGYIFTGNTVDLNEILETGGELPRDKYVTFTCDMPLGNYAETQEYLNGIIPLPSKTQQYALLSNTGMILSAEIKKQSQIDELDQAIDAFYDDQMVSVTVTGCLVINSSEMDDFLEEFTDYLFGDDMDSSGIFLTSYVIDATRTRLSITLVYVLVFALGTFLIAASIRALRKSM